MNLPPSSTPMLFRVSSHVPDVINTTLRRPFLLGRQRSLPATWGKTWRRLNTYISAGPAGGGSLSLGRGRSCGCWCSIWSGQVQADGLPSSAVWLLLAEDCDCRHKDKRLEGPILRAQIRPLISSPAWFCEALTSEEGPTFDRSFGNEGRFRRCF